MERENIYLTREGYEKLRKKLKFLKTVRRRELSKAIGQAIAHGDISDNAEYDAAKDAQGLLGHKENETVEIKVPAGILRYKILKISR